MKTQYYAAASLDGFLATEDHSLDWLLQFGEVEGSTYPEFIGEIGALAMGSATYRWLLDQLSLTRARPTPTKPWPYAQPTWVFTRRDQPTVPGADIRFVSGDVASVHRKMAEAAGERNRWIVGGGELAAQFYDAGLLDELIIQVTPVTLGQGRPLFPRRVASPPFRLLSARTIGGTFTEVRLAVPGRAGG